MGPAAAGMAISDVLGGFRSECRSGGPAAGIDEADLARDNRPWLPAVGTGPATGALSELGPGTDRQGAAVISNHSRIDSTAAQRLLIRRDD
jgi:hypothetical protein